MNLFKSTSGDFKNYKADSFSEKETNINWTSKRVMVLSVVLLLLSSGITALYVTKAKSNQQDLSPAEISEVEKNEEILILTKQLEELKVKYEANELYIKNLNAILSGEVEMPEIDKETNKPVLDLSEIDLSPQKEDLELRKQVELEENLDLLQENDFGQEHNLFFPPVKGIVTGEFEPEKSHWAIDVAAQQGEAIKSIEQGIVIFSGWTADTGFVVIVQHPMDIISVYKHAMNVYKNAGDIIQKGEVIAAVGNTGELTTGPHLHFELWMNGTPVDPKEYIVF